MASSSITAPHKGVKRRPPGPSFMMLSELVNVVSRSAPISVMPANTRTGSEAASIAPNTMPVCLSK